MAFGGLGFRLQEFPCLGLGMNKVEARTVYCWHPDKRFPESRDPLKGKSSPKPVPVAKRGRV